MYLKCVSVCAYRLLSGGSGDSKIRENSLCCRSSVCPLFRVISGLTGRSEPDGTKIRTQVKSVLGCSSPAHRFIIQIWGGKQQTSFLFLRYYTYKCWLKSNLASHFDSSLYLEIGESHLKSPSRRHRLTQLQKKYARHHTVTGRK